MSLPEFDASMLTLMAVALVAGLVRGFSGFGTGMIIAPAAGALYGPKAAIAIIFIADSLPAIPVTIPALRIARWREVLPIMAGYLLLIPAGIWLLKRGDAVVLRWTISIVIFVMVAALWSGWRYRGPRNMAVSGGVGGVSGLLSGLAALPGPPVIMYWLASAAPASIVRANMLVFLLLAEIATGANLWASGLLTADPVMRGAVIAPFYFAGIGGGALMFGLASAETYRRAAFVLILLSATLALPALDGLYP